MADEMMCPKERAFRARADRCRKLAGASFCAAFRAKLVELADDYDRQALTFGSC